MLKIHKSDILLILNFLLTDEHFTFDLIDGDYNPWSGSFKSPGINQNTLLN
jgi:hypothetical protein